MHLWHMPDWMWPEDDGGVQPEITGEDASRIEAESGSAGNGASPWGADLTGYSPEQQELEERLEEEPGRQEDIRPDHIFQGAAPELAGEQEPEITARPSTLTAAPLP